MRCLPDEFERLLHGLRLLGGHEYRAVVLDVDVDARGRGNRVDHLAAGADQRPYFFRVDFQRGDPWGVARKLGPRRGQCARQHFQDFHSGLPRLRERGGEHGNVEPVDLHVHLNCGDSFRGACGLEVHVAVVILGPLEISEDQVVLRSGFLILCSPHESHCDPGHRSRQRHARVEERES